MSHIPDELKYASSHEWARLDDDGLVTVGITDHAQTLLGDIVYVELPIEGTEIGAGEEAGVVESVKAASDIYSPIDGIVVKINQTLVEEGNHGMPELINSDPYGEGWLFRVQPNDEEDLDELLDAEKYAEQVAAEGH